MDENAVQKKEETGIYAGVMLFASLSGSFPCVLYEAKCEAAWFFFVFSHTRKYKKG